MKELTALFLGDVVGQSGVRALFAGLGDLIKKQRADFVAVNGENAQAGFGITPELALTFFSLGVNVITSGNHIWQKKEILPFLESREDILRPANYPAKAPGKGSTVVTVRGIPVGVINLQGRQDLPAINCPFQTGREVVRKMREQTRIILVDFHAEAPEEKEALGLYLDGSVSAVLGTHTHVQTSDDRILPKGSAYITDLGMCGPRDSVIGSHTGQAIQRALTQMPLKIEVSENQGRLSGVVIRMDGETGRPLEFRRI
ncbi:MAG: TIGR00282 family metallophosphoesterase [Spirochaetales bacterium]|nr:TIGR00282 family metallophosphoesterase [Spirochaetales bacterium]